jgi:YVTN family beta-propeller protein
VGVIDTQTNRVTQQLNLPGGGANGVALTPDGRTLYVSMSDSNNLVVVSTATNTVTTSLPAPPGAEAIIGVAPIATTTDGRHVFINAYTPGSGGVAQSVLAIVSTATNTVTGTVSTSGGQSAGMNLLGLTPPNVLARATGATSTATVNRRGQVSLRTSCPRSSGTPNCIGRVALVTRTGGVPLGAAPFNARAGRTVTSRISLSRAARRMVGRRGLAAFTVTQTNQPGGGAVLSNRNVRLRR